MTEPKCKSMVDVGFLLDSSGSLANDYQKEKNFLKALAGTFGISADGAHSGVITFSSRAEHSIKMKEHTDIDSFNAAVDRIPLMGFQTRIDRALRLAQAELFAVENGARVNTPKILVLLTDGSQTDADGAEAPAKIADELRSIGVTFIVIGIGSGIDMGELDSIAGGPGKAHSASSFEELVSGAFLTSLSQSTCDVGMY